MTPDCPARIPVPDAAAIVLPGPPLLGVASVPAAVVGVALLGHAAVDSPRLVGVRVGLEGVPAPPRLLDPCLPAWVQAWRPKHSLRACPDGGTHVRIGVDTSGSVVHKIGVQHALLARLTDHLGGACTCGRCTVEVISFGRANASDIATTGPLLWKRLAPARDFLLHPPRTGSKIAGVVHHLAGHPDPNAITVVSSDFELFDDFPAGLLSTLGNLGPGVAAAIHTPPSAALRESGLTVVRITPDADRTALVDSLVDLVAAHRPAMPPPSIPAPRTGGDLPTETDGAAAEQTGPPARRRVAIALIALVPLLLAAFLLVGHPRHRNDGASAHGAQVGVAHAGPGQADSAPRLGGFGLPAPQGNRVRTEPADTVWLFDPSLNRAARATLVSELPTVIRYTHAWGLAEDRTTLDGSRGQLRPGLTLAAATRPSYATLIGPAVIDRATALLTRRYLPTDRAVIIVTDRPQYWLPLLPSQPYPVPAGDHGHPEIRYYVVATTSAPTSVAHQTLPLAGPIVIRANPATHGQLGTALAHAWVDNTTGVWNRSN